MARTKIVILLIALFGAAEGAHASSSPLPPICVPLASRLTQAIQSESSLTVKYIKAMEAVALTANAFEPQDMRHLTTASSPGNPFDLIPTRLSRAEAHSYSLIFERILEADRQTNALDWPIIKEEIDVLIRRLEEKQDDRQQAKDETRDILLPKSLAPLQIEHAVDVTPFSLFGHDLFLEVDQGDRHLESTKYFYDTVTQKKLLQGTQLATFVASDGNTYLGAYDYHTGYSIYQIDSQHNLKPVKVDLRFSRETFWGPGSYPPVGFIGENDKGHLCIYERINKGGRYVDLPKLKGLLEYDLVDGRTRKFSISQSRFNEVMISKSGHIINRKRTITGQLKFVDVTMDQTLSSVKVPPSQKKSLFGHRVVGEEFNRLLRIWDPQEPLVTETGWFYPATGENYDRPSKQNFVTSVIFTNHRGTSRLLKIPEQAASHLILYDEATEASRTFDFEESPGIVSGALHLQLKNQKEVYLFASRRGTDGSHITWFDPETGVSAEFSYEKLGVTGSSFLTAVATNTGTVILYFLEDGTGTPWGSFMRKVRRIQIYGLVKNESGPETSTQP